MSGISSRRHYCARCGKCVTPISGSSEADKGAAIAAREFTHQGGKLHTGLLEQRTAAKAGWKADRMDAHAWPTLGITRVDARDIVHHRADVVVGELVTEHIETDVAVGAR